MVRAKGKVLVTGADGFIGSHLAEELVRRGFDVRAMVMYNSLGHWGWLDHSPEDIKKELEIFPADIRDPHYTEKAVESVRTVFHLASLIAIPFSYHSPDSYVETNIRGTLNLLQAARKQMVDCFVHTSTSEVYGSARYVPIDENHPQSAQSPYAATKIAADQLARSFYSSYGLPVTIVRPFNAYGPRQSARAVIPTIITQIAAGNKEIKLGAITPRRDFTYVTDTVAGLIAASQHTAATGQTINLGFGEDIPIEELAMKIAGIMNREITIIEDGPRIRPSGSEVVRLCAENHKARELLEWEPKHSLSVGLALTIDWFSNPHNLALYKTDRYVL